MLKNIFKTDSFKKVLLHISVILTLFIGLLLFFFYVYLPRTTNHGETITVPKLIGMNSAQLEDFLSSRNLRYKINDSTYTPDAKPYTVLTQHPLPDSKVKENRMIYVTIATKNAPKVAMPALVDMSLKGAQLSLKQHDLLLGDILYVAGNQDMVYDQLVNGKKIEPGAMISKGTKIALKIGNSTGNAIETPDFRGMDIESAKAMAHDAGVLIEIRPDHNATTGTIVRQKPSPDETREIKTGETIDVWVE
jgi:eukaryotic-like serine/threonine-protein kinase